MIPYASRTGTRRNLEALRKAQWRFMVSAKGRHPITLSAIFGFQYALDNGAWHAFAHQSAFDRTAFLEAYRELGPGADFVVLPDIVAGGLSSLAFSLQWRNDLGTPSCPQLLAVQDGMTIDDVHPLIGPELGVFVGGSDQFKEKTMAQWGECARQRGAYFHVARVNTNRRIHLCEASGADSFDGSSASRYVLTLPALDQARKQRDLFSNRPS